KRTQCTAGRSPVNRPCPVISAGSSRRRIARPTQVKPEPLVPCALITGPAFRSFLRPTPSSHLGSCALLQRSSYDGAYEVAPILGVGLMIFQRIDRSCGGLGCCAKNFVAGYLAVKDGLSFRDATRKRLGTAEADPGSGDLARIQAVCDQRSGHGEIAGA